MHTVYTRPKNAKGTYTYQAVKVARGIRTGDLEPPFYVRHLQKWIRLDAQDFTAAKKAADEFDGVREATAKGLTVAEAENITNANRVPLKVAVDEYLNLKTNRARKTQQQYALALKQFVESASRVRFLDEITQNVLRKFKSDMEAAGYSGKTCDTRIGVVYFMLKKNRIEPRIPRDELPVIEQEDAVPYTDEELAQLFKAMDAEDTLRYKFFLGSGCREQEVTFATKLRCINPRLTNLLKGCIPWAGWVKSKKW